jgi:O-antigen ligase
MTPAPTLSSSFRLETVVTAGTGSLLFILLLLGGGGAPAPLMQAVLEAAAFLWLLLLGWLNIFRPRNWHLPMFPALLIFGAGLIPLLQLIPLPYGVWSSLPGRDAAVEALRLAELGEPAMPLSLDPEGTRMAGFQLLPSIAVFFGTLSVEPRERPLITRSILIVATLSGLLGALQFARPGMGSLYLFSANFTISGLFANRNAHSDLLLIGMLCCGYEVRRAGSRQRGASAQLAAHSLLLPLFVFLALAVLITQSRSGFLLLLPVIAASTYIALPRLPKRVLLVTLGASVLTLAGGIMAARQLAFDVIARFSKGDSRFEPYPDVILALKEYFPFGSGLGTFDPVYRQVESLSTLRPNYLHHAHNDYLEIVLETGLSGALLLAIGLAGSALQAWKVLRRNPSTEYAWLQRVAIAGIAILLIHSAFDYPLRTITLQCVFAYFAAILFTNEPTEHQPEGGSA